MSERIAKRLARVGLCSRREAERWILAGRVKVDGVRLISPAINVGNHNEIRVDDDLVGRPLQRRLWRYHKPINIITTRHDPRARQTVFETLPDELPRVISVGRLDFASEGLLLLTNDGELAQYLSHPKYGYLRRYRVQVNGSVDASKLDSLSKGISIRGIVYGPIAVEIEQTRGRFSWLRVELKEGKNREIRRVMSHIGLKTQRLIRIGYGPFSLGRLAPGTVARVPERLIGPIVSYAVRYHEGR